MIQLEIGNNLLVKKLQNEVQQRDELVKTRPRNFELLTTLYFSLKIN